MPDIMDLIAEILDNPKLKNVASKIQSEYHDEPILRTAAQMARRLPKPLADAKKLAQRPNQYHYSYNELFLRQAKLLEDFTDNAPESADFFSYSPTYRDMSDRQLRTYFTWRTKVRRGIVEHIPLSYAEVYCFELLNQIGVPDPETGFQMLRQFYYDYGKVDPHNGLCYFSSWMHDYVIYYGMDAALLEEFDAGHGTAFDTYFPVLLDESEHSKEEIFSALSALSGQSIVRSRFYRDETRLMEQGAVFCFHALCVYFEKHKKTSFLEYLFGRQSELPYHMFTNAVFFEQDPHKNCDFVLSPCHAYHCRNGEWTCETYFDYSKGSKRLGLFLKTIDQKLRILTDYGHPLKETELPKYIQQALDKALAEFLEERRRAAAPKPKPIQFDLSRLQNIRQAADTTRDKLLVNEDVTQEPEPPVIAAPTPAPEPEHTPAQDSRLSETETAFLRCLLDGTPYADLLRQRNVMLSVLVDHINETLFDDFGDTVILFDGDTPELIEDYAEDVAALLETSV